MTPFEYFVFTGWIATCVFFYFWEKKCKRKIRKHYRKKFKKKLQKRRKKFLHIDGE